MVFMFLSVVFRSYNVALNYINNGFQEHKLVINNGAQVCPIPHCPTYAYRIYIFRNKKFNFLSVSL